MFGPKQGRAVTMSSEDFGNFPGMFIKQGDRGFAIGIRLGCNQVEGLLMWRPALRRIGQVLDRRMWLANKIL